MRQLVLFDEVDYEKLAKIDGTIDGIRDRFGIDAIERAVFVDQPIDHMSGGISREKRTVDYDRIVVQEEGRSFHGIWNWYKYKRSRCRFCTGNAKRNCL